MGDLTRRGFYGRLAAVVGTAAVTDPGRWFRDLTVAYYRHGRLHIKTISRFCGLPYAVRKGR